MIAFDMSSAIWVQVGRRLFGSRWTTTIWAGENDIERAASAYGAHWPALMARNFVADRRSWFVGGDGLDTSNRSSKRSATAV
jgi:hypothetical protein